MPALHPRLELRGEFTHFYDPVPLLPSARGDGHLEVALSAPAGVYRYKLRDDQGGWHLDPHNPRTASRDGLRDSVLCLGGTAEPLLHAPAPPWCFVRDDGRLCVRAALRRGHGDRLALRLLGPDGAELPMRPVAAEDEHVFFEAHLAAPPRSLRYTFLLSSGQAIGPATGAAFRVRPAALRPRTPAWWRDAVLYTVFVDRYRRGAGGFLDRPREDDRAGGDLDGLRAALPHLSALGVTVLHLTPLCLSASAHRYDAVDPAAVDPALGGEAALADLLQEAHAVGLRVLLDLALTHVHRDHFAFSDVRARGFDSPYAPWFRLRRYPFDEGAPDPGYEHYQKGRWQEPLLDLRCDDVVEYLCDVVSGWLRRGADGLRIDAAADLPPSVLRRLAAAARAVRPDALLFGEVIPHNAARFLAAGLDAATDFPAQALLLRWLTGAADGPTTAAALARRALDRGPGWQGVLFTATHDQHRLLSHVADPRLARLAHLYLFTRPEVPAVYYGDEVGLRASDASRDFEGAWPDRQPMPWDQAAWDHETLRLFQAAIALRRSTPALRGGDDVFLPSSGPVLAYRRLCPEGGDAVDVYLNGSDTAVTVPLASGAGEDAELLLSCGAASLTSGAITLSPYGGAVLRRRPAAALRVLWDQAQREARALLRAAFVAGQVELPVLPPQLYVTVTEACNLVCRHCITDAPARTREGRARTLTPAVLAALRPALAAADYLGLSHGGESLVSPALWDLLGSYRDARAVSSQPPGDVHLLSNGMLLTEATVRRLARAGVTSLAVSLDGASAATNDYVRQGARRDVILANLRAALRLRAAENLNLRIGLSTVVLAANVEELGELGRLAAELGVDWLKVEELAPVNGFSRRELLAPRDRRVRAGLAALRASAGDLIIVDHLDHRQAPRACRCQGDPETLVFRDADDFANRARFFPCRMAWEQLCVDPDGTVRAVDYHAPPLGSIAAAPLLTVWNSPAAQEQRRAALRALPPAHRARCAALDPR